MNREMEAVVCWPQYLTLKFSLVSQGFSCYVVHFKCYFLQHPLNYMNPIVSFELLLDPLLVILIPDYHWPNANPTVIAEIHYLVLVVNQ